MHNRALIVLLTGTAAPGLATLGWTQTTSPMTDTATPPGSTTSTAAQTMSDTSAADSTTTGRTAPKSAASPR
jgi:hypothetical protein